MKYSEFLVDCKTIIYLKTQKYPIIILLKHSFTFSVSNHFHTLFFHAGAETTLSLIRSKLWIVSARSVVRKIIFNCISCKRINSTASQKRMADLPAARGILKYLFKVNSGDEI